MKKIFISILLFLLALTALAFDPVALYTYIDRHPYDLLQGTPQLQQLDVREFTGQYQLNAPAANAYFTAQGDPTPYMQAYDTWYRYDFAEEPFDGRLEIYVFGSPLPSAKATLFIVLLTAGIIMWSRNRLQRTAA